MKKIIAGGFLMLTGTAWMHMLASYVTDHLVTSWYGSRFLESADALGLSLPVWISLAAVAAGMVLMAVGLFAKEKQ
ncbi:MAG: hypothetical protein IKK21_04205 [Clostridia bacterium]|nr:hypothetical protein [Clostridia bacterium]